MKNIGIDVSRWRPKLIAAKLEGHVKWLSAKAVEVDDQIYGWNANMAVDLFIDPTFAGHCQTAHDIGAPFVPFIFTNTRYKSEYYASAFADHVRHPNGEDAEMIALRHALENKTYAGLAIDCERWWKFYNQYLAMLRGELPGDQVEKLGALWIRDSIQDEYIRIQEDMRLGYIDDVPIWFYFGKYFVDGYSPELDTFLADKLQWVTKYNGPVYQASIKTSAANIGEWEDLEEIVAANGFTAPWVGNRPADVYQLTDKYFLPGIQDKEGRPLAVDVDITISDWSMLFKPGTTEPPVGVDPDPDPIPVPTVTYLATIRQTAAGLKLRTAPNTTAPILDGDFRPQVQFEIAGAPVVDGAITWASLGKAYFAVKQGTYTYADVVTK